MNTDNYKKIYLETSIYTHQTANYNLAKERKHILDEDAAGFFIAIHKNKFNAWESAYLIYMLTEDIPYSLIPELCNYSWKNLNHAERHYVTSISRQKLIENRRLIENTLRIINQYRELL